MNSTLRHRIAVQKTRSSWWDRYLDSTDGAPQSIGVTRNRRDRKRVWLTSETIQEITR
jgi:hypothetical protein